MSNIQHSITNFHYSFKHFSKLVQLPVVLRQANILKTKGTPVSLLLEWLLATIFHRYSIFRATASSFSKRTARNCLNDPRTNWQRLVTLLAVHLIQYVQHFTDSRRRQALIIDDSLFKREFSKKTELLARVFDHDKQVFFKGFRTLTLGWSDGNTFLPVHFALMSSSNSQNQIGLFKKFDHRTLAARRRAQAQRQMNDVALELVDNAISAGIKARYVLFDSWFASPHMFAELLRRGRYGIGMLKRSKKVYFRYRGRQMDVKTLYNQLRRSKWSTRSHYLYSPIVSFEVNGHSMLVKLVFVTKRGAHNDYLVLGTTNTDLHPQEIIRMYARRWQIEGYFKVAKQYLQFDKTQIQSYDGLCGHMALVLIGYDILALAQRENTDDRTFGGMFFDYSRPLSEIKISDALSWLMITLTGIAKKLDMSKEILDTIFDEFIKALPSNLVRLLGKAQ
ncbi:transposase [Levilactobacillus koreensis]|uniref:Transposase n=1 Tax=Levilactobacillus koreensis TaxID=637971 RepID=A0AAC8UTW6_9LACO|nr:transposase [Levilactobacillus koreensis]AKP64296.1 transposase [Levilactobacillus koreensis]